MLKDKTTLITGEIDPLGNAVLERFLKVEDGSNSISKRDEKKQKDMRHPLYNDKMKHYKGDVKGNEIKIKEKLPQGIIKCSDGRYLTRYTHNSFIR